MSEKTVTITFTRNEYLEILCALDNRITRLFPDALIKEYTGDEFALRESLKRNYHCVKNSCVALGKLESAWPKEA